MRETKIVAVRKATGLGVAIYFWALPKEMEDHKYEKGVLLDVENVFGECNSFTGSESLRSFLKMNGIYLTTTEMIDLIKELSLNKKEFEEKYGALVEVCDIIVKDNKDDLKKNVPERIREVEQVVVNWYKRFLEEARKKSALEKVGKLAKYEL